eukprot:scaffold5660_cov114-Skeletonema_marinoi.AAC.5
MVNFDFVKPTVSSIVSLPADRPDLLSQEYISNNRMYISSIIVYRGQSIQPTQSSLPCSFCKEAAHLFPSPSEPQSVHKKITSCLHYITAAS